MEVIRIKRKQGDEAIDSILLGSIKKLKDDSIQRVFRRVVAGEQGNHALSSLYENDKTYRDSVKNSTKIDKRPKDAELKKEEHKNWRLKVIQERRESDYRVIDAVIEKQDLSFDDLSIKEELYTFDYFIESEATEVVGNWLAWEKYESDLLYEQSSDDEHVDEYDEDSNDENYYRNEYPEESDVYWSSEDDIYY